MTISDVRAAVAEGTTTAVAEALQRAIFSDRDLQFRMRDALLEIDDRPRPDLTHSQEAELAPGLLPKALVAAGVTVIELARDTQLRGAFIDWAAVLAPRLFLILTGQIDLSAYAIDALGDGSDYQRQCLSELDTGATVGGLALTELGGTNGNDCRTTAEYDVGTDGYWLDSTTRDGSKFMPNIGGKGAAKTFLVTARLIVDGRDEGVVPFLARLRTAEGLAEGVRVFRLPDTGAGPMDHALIYFRRFWVPRQALLAGSAARLSADGRIESDTPDPRKRFGRVIAVLSRGRLDLATAAAAMQRAALVGFYRYGSERTSGAGTVMLDRDNVAQDLMPAVAAAYATSALGRRLRDMATDDPDGPHGAVLAMLAKPLVSDTAAEVLEISRRRAAGQAVLRSNRIVDWIRGGTAIITAEGENNIMAVVAADVGVDLTAIQLPGTPRVLPWYVDVLAQRARIIAEGIEGGNYAVAGAVMGRDSARVAYTTTSGERLAATSLVISAEETSDPTAAAVLRLLAEAYALDRIARHGLWYTARGLMTAEHAEQVEIRLVQAWRLLAEALPTLVGAFAIPVIPGAPLYAPEGYKAATANAAEAAHPGFFD